MKYGYPWNSQWYHDLKNGTTIWEIHTPKYAIDIENANRRKTPVYPGWRFTVLWTLHPALGKGGHPEVLLNFEILCRLAGLLQSVGRSDTSDKNTPEKNEAPHRPTYPDTLLKRDIHQQTQNYSNSATHKHTETQTHTHTDRHRHRHTNTHTHTHTQTCKTACTH